MPRIFLDLDGTLIRSYYEREVPSLGPLASRCLPVFKDVVTVPRPGLKGFLERLSDVCTVSLFTAAEREYADAVLETCGVSSFFGDRIHSSQEEMPDSIDPGSHWVLVDDTPADKELTAYKLSCLGVRRYARATRHFYNIRSYQPHIQEELDHLSLVVELLKRQLTRTGNYSSL